MNTIKGLGSMNPILPGGSERKETRKNDDKKQITRGRETIAISPVNSKVPLTSQKNLKQGIRSNLKPGELSSEKNTQHGGVRKPLPRPPGFLPGLTETENKILAIQGQAIPRRSPGPRIRGRDIPSKLPSMQTVETKRDHPQSSPQEEKKNPPQTQTESRTQQKHTIPSKTLPKIPTPSNPVSREKPRDGGKKELPSPAAQGKLKQFGLQVKEKAKDTKEKMKKKMDQSLVEGIPKKNLIKGAGHFLKKK